ncbi:30S ribosomal protein S20 [Patescibacteria group bacterium]
MPITHAAKKGLRQNKRRRIKNLKDIKKMKDLLKEVKSLISQKKIQEAKKILPQVYKVLDKSAKIGIIKKNRAIRTKSRIAKAIVKIK